MKLNDFLFVTCLTPSSSMSPLRKELFELYKAALQAQTSQNWSVLLMGEEDSTEGNFISVRAKTQTKEDKLLEAYGLLMQLDKKPKFLIRLDDDDIFSRSAISDIENKKPGFDVYVDKFQCMYNVFNQKSLCREYAWFPSTLVMKFDDAVTKIAYFNNLPLFVCDHDQVFHKYYADKKVCYSQKDSPLYLRVFSPTSLSFSDSKNKFENYCNSFGTWKFSSFTGFEWAEKKLEALNRVYFNTALPNKFLYNLTAGIVGFLKRVKRKIIG